MLSFGDLVERVRAYHPAPDVEVLRRAYDYSEEVHRGQTRKSGEPYVTHPVEVAGLIADLQLDVASVATGLLHDTVEDTLATLPEIENLFGSEIAALVDGVTKISQLSVESREEKQAENFRKMVLAMSKDIRVILVKLADRTHNMRTLGHLKPDKQVEIAQETLDLYAPLANRLGINHIKNELEDNALRYLHPEIYHQIKRWVAKKKEEREKYIRDLVGLLSTRLEEAGIEAIVSGRPKHFYSIWKKMETQKILFDQVYDLVGFRVIVESTRECYEALGIVHANWKPVAGRFKDYIALPKANLYQSLHTTVIGSHGERTEFQIRSGEMHRVAEDGIAAHWRYKEGGEATDDFERPSWLDQLVEWQHRLSDPREFLQSVKADLFADDVGVFTPTGEIVNLPDGATPVDFAYRIHSEIGNHCAGARVNGKLVPLRYKLRSGESVEIVTTEEQSPSKEWLRFVRTSRARERIRTYFKDEQRARSVALGRELLERDLQRHALDLASLRDEERWVEALAALGFRDEESLLASIGYGRTTTAPVLRRVLPPGSFDESAPKAAAAPGALSRLLRLVTGPEPSTGVVVTGMGDTLVRFGRCCGPLPGDEIAGFLTRGRGVTVHAADCTRVLESDPARRIEVVWEDGASRPRRVRVQVRNVDQPGMLAATANVIAASGINIVRAELKNDGEGRSMTTFDLMVERADDLSKVMREIQRVRGVIRVERAKR